LQPLWFSIFDFSFDYKGTEPAFIDPAPFPWAAELKANYSIIKQELSDYLEKKQLKSYFNASMVSRQNSWRTISLKTWNIALYKNQKDFPATTALLKKYPEIISASFNLLEPHSRILPHCGDTNAIYRCHLGLEVPAGLPECGFRVKEEKRAWVNGEWLVFMDAYNHEAWNDTGNERYIFLIDVIREEHYNARYRVGATVLSSLFLQKRLGSRGVKLVKRPLLVKAMARTAQPFAWVAVHLANFFKWF